MKIYCEKCRGVGMLNDGFNMDPLLGFMPKNYRMCPDCQGKGFTEADHTQEQFDALLLRDAEMTIVAGAGKALLTGLFEGTGEEYIAGVVSEYHKTCERGRQARKIMEVEE